MCTPLVKTSDVNITIYQPGYKIIHYNQPLETGKIMEKNVAFEPL